MLSVPASKTASARFLPKRKNCCASFPCDAWLPASAWKKVFLKGGRMSLFFVSNPDSPYYQSQAFGKVIAYMMKYTRRCDLREQNNKRSMLVKDVRTVERSCLCVAGGSGNAGGGVTVATPATNVRTARRIPN